MDYKWDENKRRSNLEKHHIDFYDAPMVFEEDYLFEERIVGGERRHLVIGVLDGIAVALIYTDRGPETRRIISLRRASRDERQKYQEVFDRRVE